MACKQGSYVSYLMCHVCCWMPLRNPVHDCACIHMLVLQPMHVRCAAGYRPFVVACCTLQCTLQCTAFPPAAKQDDCELGPGGARKACKNCSCGRAEAEAAGVKVELTKDMLDNPQSACGNVSCSLRLEACCLRRVEAGGLGRSRVNGWTRHCCPSSRDRMWVEPAMLGTQSAIVCSFLGLCRVVNALSS